MSSASSQSLKVFSVTYGQHPRKAERSFSDAMPHQGRHRRRERPRTKRITATCMILYCTAACTHKLDLTVGRSHTPTDDYEHRTAGRRWCPPKSGHSIPPPPPSSQHTFVCGAPFRPENTQQQRDDFSPLLHSIIDEIVPIEDLNT